ncbi:hypothetical protein Agub_g455 [Astrephomene gubernaculifera]|uniref:Uncharacterized protein n=1 Tax=Astrephomene gubernaculifera TaxID=47775 RepID=A0AAD3DEF8_9CHLO|nr:hypothetical protein Agub_g455 [Astrephomene gubernaculifera]
MRSGPKRDGNSGGDGRPSGCLLQPPALGGSPAARTTATTHGVDATGGVGSGGGGCTRLPGQISLLALAAGGRAAASVSRSEQLQQHQGAAAAAPPPVAVASVAFVECLREPLGSGAPYETAGGSWLLHLADADSGSSSSGSGSGGRMPGAGAGGQIRGGGAGDGSGAGGAGGGGTAVPMYLHSELRLLVMGRLPLLAAGRRVRIAAVPPRTGPAAASPMASRLLPTRHLVPELPPSWLAGGCWPHVDALRHGGSEPWSLQAANEDAAASLAPGCCKVAEGWVLARVAAVEPHPPAEGGAYDRHRQRTVHLVNPALPSTTLPSTASSCTTTFTLYGDAVAMGDLILPGETIAVYQPLVMVQASSARAVVNNLEDERQQDARTAAPVVLYEYTPETLVVVLPTTERTTEASATGLAVMGQQQQQQQLQQQQASVYNHPSEQEPLHAVSGLGCFSSSSPQPATAAAAAAVTSPATRTASGTAVALAGRVSPTATPVVHLASTTAATTADVAAAATAALAVPPGCRTAVVARVEALLGFNHGASINKGGRVRALLSDGTGRAAVEMHLEKGSKAPSHLREGHIIVLLGAVPLPTVSSTAMTLASLAAATQPRQQSQQQQQQQRPQQHPQQMQQQLHRQGSFGDDGGSNIGGHRGSAGVQPLSSSAKLPVVLPAFVWVEAADGSEVHSLTAMPAQVTTPSLVSYTSLAAVQLATSSLQLRSPGVVLPSYHSYGNLPTQYHPPGNYYQHQHHYQQQRGACHQQQQGFSIAGASSRPSSPSSSGGGSRNGSTCGGSWPAGQFDALAAATRQVPDTRSAWGRDVPYVRQPYIGTTTAVAAFSAADTATATSPVFMTTGGGRAIRHVTSPSALTTTGPRPGPAGFGATATATPCTAAAAGTARGSSPPASPLASSPGAAGAAAAPKPDGLCGAVACVVVVRAADVATHRVHRNCGRPVVRSSAMMDIDFADFDDDDDDCDGGGGAGGGAAGVTPAAVSVPPGPAAAAAAPSAAQDTPSKDQSMDGLWECEFCKVDAVKEELEWQYHGSLTLEDVVQPYNPPSTTTTTMSSIANRSSGGGASGAGSQLSVGTVPAAATAAAAAAHAAVAAATAAGNAPGFAATSSAAIAAATLTLPADPAALQGLLGVSAAAFHSLATARRRKVVEVRGATHGSAN